MFYNILFCHTKSVHLAFKFCLTKSVHLALNETNLIKANEMIN